MNKRIKKKKRKSCDVCGHLDHLKDTGDTLYRCNHCYEIYLKQEYDCGGWSDGKRKRFKEIYKALEGKLWNV